MFATVALVFGASVAFSATAHAVPGDSVVFADQALEDVVNAALGQTSGDTITEAQAAGISTLFASNKGITDLTGIEYMNSLTTVYLSGNAIADVTPLADLTSLTTMHLANNAIADVTPLADLTSVTLLNLYNNAITDVTPLANLTSVTRLNLNDNAITDVTPLADLTRLTNLEVGRNAIVDMSPLTGLTRLTSLYLSGQSIVLLSVDAGTATSNPVVDAVGNAVAVTSTDTGFSYDAGSNTWSFTGLSGTKTMTWDIPVTAGSLTGVQFSGTISQDVIAWVTPESPVISQAFCVDEEVVSPQITLPETDGIDYELEGTVEAGATVTVIAHAIEGNQIEVPLDSDWVVDTDLVSATLEVILDAVDCEVPPVVDTPEVDDDTSAVEPVEQETAELAKTGAEQSVVLFGLFGALLALVGAALVVARRRITTR